VELFHLCFFADSTFLGGGVGEASDMLEVALWPLRKNIDARSRSVGTGSVDGSRTVPFLDGVLRPGAVNRAANLRNGDIDRDSVEAVEGARLRGGDGVSRKPFPDFETRDVEDSVSRRSISIRLTPSISVSILLIRSRRLRHRCRISAFIRKHSPFFVCRSLIPLSTTDNIFVTEGI